MSAFLMGRRVTPGWRETPSEQDTPPPHLEQAVARQSEVRAEVAPAAAVERRAGGVEDEDLTADKTQIAAATQLIGGSARGPLLLFFSSAAVVLALRNIRRAATSTTTIDFLASPR